jgi:hypothetical protein
VPGKQTGSDSPRSVFHADDDGDGNPLIWSAASSDLELDFHVVTIDDHPIVG